MTAKFKNVDEIKYLIIHSTLTTSDEHLTLEDIDRIHRNKNLLSCGYHRIVRRDGFIEHGRPLNRAGVHTEGHDHHSIGICMVGGVNSAGVPVNNFTDAQFKNLEWLIRNLTVDYVNAKVVGHNMLDQSTQCPCFSVNHWLMKTGLAKLHK